MATKNITLAIDEDLLDKARVLAAMRRTSVNEMVRTLLNKEVDQEQRQADRAQVWGDLFAETDASASGTTRKAGEKLFDRVETHEEAMRDRGLL